MTSLTTNSPLIQESIVQIQTDFPLGGDGRLFAGIDAAVVTAELPTESVLVTGPEPGATPVATPLASPEITVVDSSAATPTGSPAAAPVDEPDATPLAGEAAALATIQSGASTPEPTPAP